MRSTQWLALSLAVLAAGGCDVVAPDAPGALVPRTVAEDSTLPAINMNGARFHVVTYGNPANPVVVFLHGGPGGDFRGLLRLADRYNGYSLANEYFLVFWDQRGTGLSQRVAREQLTQDVYDADLDALIERFAPGRQVLLVGESWGGMFATRYINVRPARIAGAVLIEPGPMDGATMERLKGDIVSVDLTAEWLNDFAWSSQFLSPDDHARMDYERLIGALESQPKFGLSAADPAPVWRMGAAASRYIQEDGQDANGVFNFDFTSNLASYTTPVLFIAGSLSQVLGASLQQQQVLHYPAASLAVVEGAGHDVAWIKPAETVALIRPYLAARQGGN